MQRQAHLLPDGPPGLPGWHPLHHWETLTPGDLVEVWSEGNVPYYAYVDDLADDGTIVWLVENGTASRRLFLHDDTVTLYTPKTEPSLLVGLTKGLR